MHGVLKKTACAAGLAIAFAAWSTGAQAVSLVSCAFDGGDVTGYVTPTSACFGIEDLSDGETQKLGDLNGIEINGSTGGWSTLGKFENTGSNANFSLNDSVAGNLEGTWTLLSGATSMYSEFMMIFKAGQDQNTEPASFVGYILAGTSGDWKSPLIGNDGSARALSNVELYGRGNAPPPGTEVIPLPAAGWLLLGGIGGLVALKRRKQAST